MRNLVTAIVGPAGSGKSVTANKLMEVFPRESVLLSYRPNPRERLLTNRYFYSGCTPNTELVVIEEVGSSTELIDIVNHCNTGIVVDRKHQAPFKINPAVVVVCDEKITRDDILSLDKVYANRIKIVEPFKLQF